MRTSSENWQTHKSVQAITAVALLVVFVLGGCTLLTPQTTALEKVHESYRTEFQQFMQLSVPAPSGSPGPNKGVADQPAFAETLRAIRDYRVRHGENSQEAAHLKVLEGMIYLQSGQVGMARLVALDVQAAERSLNSGTGTYTRDQLLARTFTYLLDGWEQIRNREQIGADAQKLQTAADNIKRELDKLDPAKLAQPDVDEGAVYLATTAAIFYVWVYQLRSFQEPNTKPQWFGKGQELIGRFLSASEKTAAAGAPAATADASTAAIPVGRLRYINWYGYLAREANPH
jgi:hypothetical protein